MLEPVESYARLDNELVQRVHLVLWLDGEYLLVSRRPGADVTGWDVPNMRVADGETIWQAASRLVLLQLGLRVKTARFKEHKIFREKFSGKEHHKSVKLRLSDDEQAQLEGAPLSGSHELRLIHKTQIREYFPRKWKRQLIS